MLVIRKEQMQVFSEHMVAQFKDRITKHLKKTFPKKACVLTDEELRKLVGKGVDKALTYGIEMDLDVEQFLGFMFRISYDFYENMDTQWANAILTDDSLTAEEKLDQIEEYAVHIDRDMED